MPENPVKSRVSGMLQLNVFYSFIHRLTRGDDNLKSLGGNTVPVQVRSPAPNGATPESEPLLFD